jgi:hypothetical protein
VNNRALTQISQIILVCVCLMAFNAAALAKRRPPAGGRPAVVVDERLSALRTTPELSGVLLRRISRGALVAITGARTSREGVVFYRINVTRRTSGWIQRDAVVAPTRGGDDARLLNLIKGSEEFDRVVRARIFLDNFRLSELRPEVLMIYSLAAEEAAVHLSRDASRRLDQGEMNAGGAPVFSYFLNYNGLDRYNRQGITFGFNSTGKSFRYDGEGWREIVHRYPKSPQAVEARKRLEALGVRK